MRTRSNTRRKGSGNECFPVLLLALSNCMPTLEVQLYRSPLGKIRLCGLLVSADGGSVLKDVESHKEVLHAACRPNANSFISINSTMTSVSFPDS